MNVNEVVPFLMIKDMATSISFYVNGIGFEIENEWRPGGVLRWCMLRLGNARFMLQEHLPDQAKGTKGTGVRICVFCEDAIALYHQFVASGIAANEPYVGNRLWVTSLTDPDGYRIDFESPTDVAEETKLSELE